MNQTDAQTQTFTFDPDADADVGRADVYVTETFKNRYDDMRAVLDGETYEAKAAIKGDWDVLHHQFDKERPKMWTVDYNDEAMNRLKELLKKDGFSFAREEPTDKHAVEIEFDNLYDALNDAHTRAIDAGDEVAITVEYEKKSGTGKATKRGFVTQVTHWSEKDKTLIKFEREDDRHTMYLKCDDKGTPALYTANSAAPFVGRLVSVIVEAEDASESDSEVCAECGREMTDVLPGIFDKCRECSDEELAEDIASADGPVRKRVSEPADIQTVRKNTDEGLTITVEVEGDDGPREIDVTITDHRKLVSAGAYEAERVLLIDNTREGGVKIRFENGDEQSVQAILG